MVKWNSQRLAAPRAVVPWLMAWYGDNEVICEQWQRDPRKQGRRWPDGRGGAGRGRAPDLGIVLVLERARDQALIRVGCRYPRRVAWPPVGLPCGPEPGGAAASAPRRAVQDAPGLREGAPHRHRRRGDPGRGPAAAARRLT